MHQMNVAAVEDHHNYINQLNGTDARVFAISRFCTSTISSSLVIETVSGCWRCWLTVSTVPECASGEH